MGDESIDLLETRDDALRHLAAGCAVDQVFLVKAAFDVDWLRIDEEIGEPARCLRPIFRGVLA